MIRNALKIISDDLMIKRWGQGVKLVKPHSIQHRENSYCAVSHLMNMPINFYFMNPDSVMVRLSERTAQTCGYISAIDAVGRSIRDISKNETAQKIIKNDREIISNKASKIIYESYTRLDDIDLNAISIKFPWYEDNKLIGIFGCSILSTSLITVADSLSLLVQAGLLSSSMTLPFVPYHSEILSDHEMDILYLLVRGNTAKSIAKHLELSFRTVEHRLEQIKMKLSVSTKAELIEKVIDLFIK